MIAGMCAGTAVGRVDCRETGVLPGVRQGWRYLLQSAACGHPYRSCTGDEGSRRTVYTGD